MHPAHRAFPSATLESQTRSRQGGIVEPSTVEPQPPGLGEVATRLREDLGMLMSAIDRERDEVEHRVRSFMHQHPVATLTATFGVGYLLGGGLFSRRSIPLLGLGLRLAGSQVVARMLGQMGETGDGSTPIPP
jgi:hypothetical protein